MKRQITVEELLRDREETLGLENLTLEAGLDRPITHPDPASPGLALAGFTERVVGGRVQVFGGNRDGLSGIPRARTGR